MVNNQILEIIPNGIIYIDENGNEGFIDLVECYHNYLKRQLAPEYIEKVRHLNHWGDDEKKLERYIKQVKERKEVGKRGLLEDPPFICFYTEPPVCFEFDSFEEAKSIEIQVWEAGGWHTFDTC